MGKLVEGVWHDIWYDTKSTGGKFVRTNAKFRNWVTADGKNAPSGEAFKAEGGRYHLYVSYACPWAHRTLIVRRLKGLEDMIGVSVVNHFMGAQGWTFHEGDGVIADPVLDAEFLHELYTAADLRFSGRVTVPVLWDKKTGTIVSNESSEIIRMFNSAFDHLGATPGDFYPDALRDEIDEVNERVYHTLNNGVYKCGFATTQQAYEEALIDLFDTLDWLEERLSKQRYLVGESDHGSRLAALHDASALRCGLRGSLQDQPAPDRGLPEPLGVHARALPSAGRQRHPQHAAHQAPLLRQPRKHQPEPHRADGAHHRFPRAPRPRRDEDPVA